MTWTKDWRAGAGWAELDVWIESPDELAEMVTRPDPFLVAVADPKDEMVPRPWAFKRFVAVLEVKSTGKRVQRRGLLTRVLRRVYG